MVHSSFAFANSALSFHFIRGFVHLFVLFVLIFHQFLFRSFVDPYLSVWAYSMCFFILFVDGLCLFFYRGNQSRLPPYLLFADAFFLSSFVVIIGPPALFLVFFLAFSQFLSLFLLNRVFWPLMFLLYLSLMLPIALLWQERLTFDDRLSLAVLIYAVLFSIFCFGWLFQSLLSVEEHKEEKPIDIKEDLSVDKPSHYIGLPLDLARKLKPVLNTLMKYFPDSTQHREHQREVSSSLFPPQKGRCQLEQMKNFILDFIEYAEPEMESLLEGTVDLRELLEKLLSQLENHLQKPENLTLKLELKGDLKVKGSAPRLRKCFEHIVLNSFEALKNQEQPKVHIQGYCDKSWAVLKFLDNGHGIESEDIKKLFDPLFSKRFGLRGLGLPYVQKTLTAHKAFLEIKSSPKGTKVTVKFPLDHTFYESGVQSGQAA